LQLKKTGNRNVASARRIQKRIFGNVSNEKLHYLPKDIYPLCWTGQWMMIEKKYLKRADKGVERLIYIVNDLDMISKLEVGDLDLDISEFDIVELIENVFELLEMKAEKKENYAFV
jgi:signal transduction histidine kinase